ncbi:MAG: DUF4062 domain-containing protein [Oscillospiraceae bacterium]|nr:DUF4062 domain-containing protein [Oscillospiraceae bacterium]
MIEKKYQIFISSTYKDLIDERNAAIKTILQLEHIPIGMEMFNAADDDQWAVIKRTIDTSDYYIVIVGFRYGSTNEQGISYTELEYDYAVSQGIPVLGFIKKRNDPSTPEQRDDDPDKQRKLNAFISKIEKKMRSEWSTADGLSAELSPALIKQFKETPRIGWIPATFDPMVLSGEIATLSKENREMRERLRLIESNKPDMELVLECADGLFFDYVYPLLLVWEKLTIEDFDQNELDALEAVDKEFRTKSAEIASMLYSQNIKHEKTSDNSVSEIEDLGFQERLIKEFGDYNTALPPQEVVAEYNTQLSRYTNMTANHHKACIRIENNGTTTANQVIVRLHFPPELLVFDSHRIKDAKEPKKVNMPRNPIRDRYDIHYPPAFVDNIEKHERMLNPDNSISYAINAFEHLNYYTENEDCLCFDVDSIVQTMGASSDYFYIVATKRGTFEIEAELICEELPEPMKKSFTVIVK